MVSQNLRETHTKIANGRRSFIGRMRNSFCRLSASRTSGNSQHVRLGYGGGRAFALRFRNEHNNGFMHGGRMSQRTARRAAHHHRFSNRSKVQNMCAAADRDPQYLRRSGSSEIQRPRPRRFRNAHDFGCLPHRAMPNGLSARDSQHLRRDRCGEVLKSEQREPNRESFRLGDYHNPGRASARRDGKLEHDGRGIGRSLRSGGRDLNNNRFGIRAACRRGECSGVKHHLVIGGHTARPRCESIGNAFNNGQCLWLQEWGSQRGHIGNAPDNGQRIAPDHNLKVHQRNERNGRFSTGAGATHLLSHGNAFYGRWSRSGAPDARSIGELNRDIERDGFSLCICAEACQRKSLRNTADFRQFERVLAAYRSAFGIERNFRLGHSELAESRESQRVSHHGRFSERVQDHFRRQTAQSDHRYPVRSA